MWIWKQMHFLSNTFIRKTWTIEKILKSLPNFFFVLFFSESPAAMADSSQQAATPAQNLPEKMAAITIEKPTGCLARVEATETATGSEATEAIYTSELRGSDESGEGTPKVPYKTILQVFCNWPISWEELLGVNFTKIGPLMFTWC